MTDQTSRRPSKQRLDIQGLRTIAVGMVIVYHLFPVLLPGGFVGVDVFFVISGFLIVGSLVREAVKTGQIRLLAFYARRIRRLLPAATAVLLTTMAATVVLLPQGRWPSVAKDVMLSALQVQNWNLALGSTSYANATAIVSPVQHYWSLAVEEQFYIVIPLLLMAAAVFAHLFKRGKEMTCLGVLAVITVASFIHSVVFSASNHDIAYFASTTRMWELGLGGVLAILMPKFSLRRTSGVVAGWTGFALVGISAVVYTTTMQFPGSIALVPVAGTMLIIAAGSNSLWVPARYSLTSLLGLSPITYIGDISYSLYLWHWPIIVFYVFRLGHPLRMHDVIVILALSIVLAVLSYKYIEQPLRHGQPIRTPAGRRFNRALVPHRTAYVLGAALLALSCTAALGPWLIVQDKIEQNNRVINAVDYPGALAFDAASPHQVKPGLPVRPDPAVATQDGPMTDKAGCNQYDPATVPDTSCWFGDLSGHSSMVVIGDSHAAQYVDPLVDLVEPLGWKVRAMVRNGCPFSTAPASSGGVALTNCSEQNKASLEKILALHPDMVVISGMTPQAYEAALHWHWQDPRELVSGYEALVKPLIAAHIEVSVILDNPYPVVSVPDCVALNGPVSAKCQTPASTTNDPVDPLRQVGADIPGVRVVNMRHYLCQQNICPAVIGNVMVYRDNHMTNTFAKSLAGPLGAALGL
ncbi:acyltransferase [Paeniglutamicibacter antarcticus]|uniref:Acyltransferase n=1 Tax=Arthrobacter terrae TaxID=2935737 RepID=A0A931CMX5_9MICC|nr:acyltransferase family protein [Arthrobacter terrae]MBG0739425.1 acyltransferase [Arthrobacter terrae]